MKAHYFLRVPCDVSESPSFFSISSRKWLANAMEIGPHIGCRFVERFQAQLGRGGIKRYVWVDEEGHVYGKPINYRASHALYPGLIAGNAAIELGPFDLDSPADAAKWDKLLARIGPRIYEIAVPKEVTPHGHN